MDMLTAVGNIAEIRINKRNLMKYLVEFKDFDGKTHRVWSNWTSQKSYDTGVSLPLKYFVIPGTFGMGVAIVELDDLPQYSEALVRFGFGVLIASVATTGFLLGKISNKK